VTGVAALKAGTNTGVRKRYPGDVPGAHSGIGIDVYETPEFYNWFERVFIK
jgi:hypothetical protein